MAKASPAAVNASVNEQTPAPGTIAQFPAT
jgi:hypothetical protein